MTAAQIELDAWRHDGKRLWSTSALAVAALHGAALALAVLWSPAVDEATPPPPAAMMIELAPLPTNTAPPSEKAPGIEQEAARPVERKIEDQPKPDTLVKKAEVALPKPKPKPAVKPPDNVPPALKPVEQTTAPSADAALEKPKMEAPAPGASAAPPSNAVPTWQGALRAQLERFKRYPAAAQFRRQEGVAYVRFALNRDGKVLWSRLEKSSGHDKLDEESLALVERAQPLPPPPAEMPGDAIEIVAPIQFFLK
ncbi:MAG TPA: TonB family protein [Candidatus Sulfotelmatobacter sp.]|jgi:protein TonB|nr:TonB family protein [Candidatus Sulfotelmatobacter sp.]